MIIKHKLVYLVVIFLALQFLILSQAKAEYRVYQLGVTYEPGQGEIEVLTTLDNLQYETYYKVSANQTTRLIDHWMCWGRTNDFTEYCEKPIKSTQAQGQGDLPGPAKN